jgi:hypothetical protein
LGQEHFMLARLIVGIFLLTLPGCMLYDTGPEKAFLTDRITPPTRLNARSPWYPLQNEQVEFYANYCGWDLARHQRIPHLEIADKVNRMVADADDLILMDFFLFDNLYVKNPPGDYVDALTDLLIAKKKANPSNKIILMLDLFHRHWGHRQSHAIDRLVAAGIDVFYSDLLQTRSAWRLPLWEDLHQAGQQANLATHGLAGIPMDLLGRIPIIIPFQLDHEFCTVDTILYASLLKANHRKAMVIKRKGVYEALTTSWNPHNASLYHENHAISVTGPLACYVYEQTREDVRRSLELGGRYVTLSNKSADYHDHFLETQLPALPESAWQPPPESSDPSQPEAAVATEQAIEPILMQWLKDIQPDDRVRIQMFYLARVPVINAILDAAARTKHPIQILLDPNRVGINYEKDGTPNVQVAAYLLERARIENAKIEIRWYSTHGEQNHAKAMTITNDKTGKYLITLGSANWTRKNLAGINLENNIFVRNAPHLNRQFNDLFDKFWSNPDPAIEYSVAYDDPRHHYNHHDDRSEWAVQRHDCFFRPLFDDKGRPELLERELVHW